MKTTHGLLGFQSRCPYGLSDFFNFGQTPRSFTPITGAIYAPTCFTTNVATCFPNYPADPDDDVIEAQQ